MSLLKSNKMCCFVLFRCRAMNFFLWLLWVVTLFVFHCFMSSDTSPTVFHSTHSTMGTEAHRTPVPTCTCNNRTELGTLAPFWFGWCGSIENILFHVVVWFSHVACLVFSNSTEKCLMPTSHDRCLETRHS